MAGDAKSFLVSLSLIFTQRLKQRRFRRKLGVLLLGAFLPFSLFLAIQMRYKTETTFHDASDILDISSIKDQADQKCIHPSLVMWSEELRAEFARKPSPLECTRVEKNWVYANNGRFYVSPEAIKSHGKIDCKYSALVRGKDDFEINFEKPQKVRGGDRLKADFFEVTCNSSDGSLYKNKHAGVVPDKIAVAKRKLSRKENNSGAKTALGLNIIIFGFDSVSRLDWMRSLPKSHSYFTKHLGGVVLEGYNIVGDGTTQALLPILTGKTETELPESRRGFEGASFVDEFPWIWKNLMDIGYMTQFGEDQSAYGTFTYRLLGFKNQPVDHFMRPFHLAVENDRRAPYCLKGSNPEHLEMMNWLREFVDVYRNELKFSFVFCAELTHDSRKYLSLADDDLLDLMKHLADSGSLDNSLFILLSDHGARFGLNRGTSHGRLEERNPYVGIRIPPKFISSYPDAFKNLKGNVHRLTTPFDLHSTLVEVIQYSGTDVGDLNERGISLFKEIPKERTCADAGIELHWCSCLQWTPQNVSSSLVTRAAKRVVDLFNQITKDFRDKCEELSVKEVRSAIKYKANDAVLKFRKSLDIHGRDPDLSDPRKANTHLYLITLVTTPGEGLFEATVTYRVQDDMFFTDSKSLSRINKYGDQPRCIADDQPHLRQFCYCKHRSV